MFQDNLSIIIFLLSLKEDDKNQVLLWVRLSLPFLELHLDNESLEVQIIHKK